MINCPYKNIDHCSFKNDISGKFKGNDNECNPLFSHKPFKCISLLNYFMEFWGSGSRKITYRQARWGDCDCGSVFPPDELGCPFGQTSGFGSDGRWTASSHLLQGGLSVGTCCCFHFYLGQRETEALWVKKWVLLFLNEAIKNSDLAISWMVQFFMYLDWYIGLFLYQTHKKFCKNSFQSLK